MRDPSRIVADEREGLARPDRVAVHVVEDRKQVGRDSKLKRAAALRVVAHVEVITEGYFDERRPPREDRIPERPGENHRPRRGREKQRPAQAPGEFPDPEHRKGEEERKHRTGEDSQAEHGAGQDEPAQAGPFPHARLGHGLLTADCPVALRAPQQEQDGAERQDEEQILGRQRKRIQRQDRVQRDDQGRNPGRAFIPGVDPPRQHVSHRRQHRGKHRLRQAGEEEAVRQSAEKVND